MVKIIQYNVEVTQVDNREQIIKGFSWAPEMSLCSRSTKARTHTKWKIHSEKLILYTWLL